MMVNKSAGTVVGKVFDARSWLERSVCNTKTDSVELEALEEEARAIADQKLRADMPFNVVQTIKAKNEKRIKEIDKEIARIEERARAISGLYAADNRVYAADGYRLHIAEYPSRDARIEAGYPDGLIKIDKGVPPAGQFPDAGAVLARAMDGAQIGVIDRADELLRIVKLASVFSPQSDTKKNTVMLRARDGMLIVSSKNHEGDCASWIPIQHGITFGFSMRVKYLSDMLGAFGSGRVRIFIPDRVAHGIAFECEKDGVILLALVMPAGESDTAGYASLEAGDYDHPAALVGLSYTSPENWKRAPKPKIVHVDWREKPSDPESSVIPRAAGLVGAADYGPGFSSVSDTDLYIQAAIGRAGMVVPAGFEWPKALREAAQSIIDAKRDYMRPIDSDPAFCEALDSALCAHLVGDVPPIYHVPYDPADKFVARSWHNHLHDWAIRGALPMVSVRYVHDDDRKTWYASLRDSLGREWDHVTMFDAGLLGVNLEHEQAGIACFEWVSLIDDRPVEAVASVPSDEIPLSSVGVVVRPECDPYGRSAWYAYRSDGIPLYIGGASPDEVIARLCNGYGAITVLQDTADQGAPIVAQDDKPADVCESAPTINPDTLADSPDADKPAYVRSFLNPVARAHALGLAWSRIDSVHAIVLDRQYYADYDTPDDRVALNALEGRLYDRKERIRFALERYAVNWPANAMAIREAFEAGKCESAPTSLRMVRSEKEIPRYVKAEKRRGSAVLKVKQIAPSPAAQPDKPAYVRPGRHHARKLHGLRKVARAFWRSVPSVPSIEAPTIPADPPAVVAQPEPEPEPINADTFANSINALTFDDLCALLADRLASAAIGRVNARLVEVGRELRTAQAHVISSIEAAQPAAAQAPSLPSIEDMPLVCEWDKPADVCPGPDWSEWGEFWETPPSPDLDDTQPMPPIEPDDDPNPAPGGGGKVDYIARIEAAGRVVGRCNARIAALDQGKRHKGRAEERARLLHYSEMGHAASARYQTALGRSVQIADHDFVRACNPAYDAELARLIEAPTKNALQNANHSDGVGGPADDKGRDVCEAQEAIKADTFTPAGEFAFQVGDTLLLIRRFNYSGSSSSVSYYRSWVQKVNRVTIKTMNTAAQICTYPKDMLNGNHMDTWAIERGDATFYLGYPPEPETEPEEDEPADVQLEPVDLLSDLADDVNHHFDRSMNARAALAMVQRQRPSEGVRAEIERLQSIVTDATGRYQAALDAITSMDPDAGAICRACVELTYDFHYSERACKAACDQMAHAANADEVRACYEMATSHLRLMEDRRADIDKLSIDWKYQNLVLVTLFRKHMQTTCDQLNGARKDAQKRIGIRIKADAIEQWA